MKGGVTHAIEEAVKALEQGKLKKALVLTDTSKTERHHNIVVDAARKCLSDKERCSVYLQDAAEKLRYTITPPLDDTNLEGVEEMLKGKPAVESKPKTEPQKTDEELYESCEECHISDALIKFHEIADQCGDTATKEVIQNKLKNEDTPPEEWLKTMIEIAEQPSCGRDGYVSVLSELVDYLDARESPILERLDEP